MNILAHLVMIKFYDNVSEEIRRKILNQYSSIAEDCGGQDAGILFFEVKPNLDQRKNWHLAELAFFTGPEALEAFRVHPKHKEITDILRETADWVVGDFMTDSDSIVCTLKG